MTYNKESLENMLLDRLHTSEELLEEWESDRRYEDSGMAAKFWSLIRKAPAVAVVGDYDVDGICGTYIVGKSVKAVCPDKRLFLRIPRRFSEGYGISEAIVEEIMQKYPEGTVVVTVDNGIAAADVLERLEDAGYPVIMTDHHALTTGRRIPKVTFAVDPCVEGISEGFSYKKWCGAAVALKLCEQYVPEALARELECFAGLATVADGMELSGANWGLVRRVVKMFREGMAPVALSNIAAALNQAPLFADEETFSWYIGPCLNAPGRLEDKGGSFALSYLFSPSTEKLEKIVEMNTSRKSLRDLQLEKVVRKIEEEGKEHDCPIWIVAEGLHEGLVGILAGRVAEMYEVPAIVGTFLPGNPEMVKASGRSFGDVDLLAYLADIPGKEGDDNWYNKFGGHSMAAGLTMEYDKFEASSAHQMERPTVSYRTQVIEIEPASIVDVSKCLERFKPFGEGNEAPTFSLEFDFGKENGKMVGDEKNHLIAESPGYKIQHFNHDPNNLSNKEHFGMVGKVGNTSFRGVETPTFKVDGVFDLCEERRIEREKQAQPGTTTETERDTRG